MKRLSHNSLNTETKVLSGIDRVILPLRQTDGSSLQAIVSREQKIERGEVIAETQEAGQARLHSPLSGEVTTVFQTIAHDGESVFAVEIRGDVDAPEKKMDPITGEISALSPEAIRARLEEAGVGPLGGNGTNTLYASLSHEDVPPEMLIVLCADEEPRLQTQSHVLREMPGEVIEGATLLQKASGAGRLVFAVRKDRKEFVSGETLLVGKRYPSALPEILMARATGKYALREDRPRKDVHVINAETAAAASMAVREGLPVLDKLVTVGLDGMESDLIRAPLGTPFSGLLKEAGLSAGNSDRLFTGGPMRGRAQFNIEAPLTKGVDSLFLQKGRKVFLFHDVACIGCGACVRICPMKIQVDMMTRNCEYSRIAEAVDYDLESCVECGLCGYVCTARRPLLQYILFAKKEKQKSERIDE